MEYLRSAVEYFVRSEMTILSPSADKLSALKETHGGAFSYMFVHGVHLFVANHYCSQGRALNDDSPDGAL